MTVSQIYDLMNSVTEEVLGEKNLVADDLSNLVDVGASVFNANAVDNYVGKLIDRIARVVMTGKLYGISVPSVMRDKFEFGAVVQKVTYNVLPEAEENQSFNLQDGYSYDPNLFYKPDVSVKYYSKKVTFDIPISFTRMQVKESFTDAYTMNSFLSLIQTAVDNSVNVKLESIVMENICNFIAETIYDAYSSGTSFSNASHVRAVNLLYEYKQIHSGSTLTATTCLTDKDFLKYSAYRMGQVEKRMKKMSTLFNCEGKPRFTPSENLVCVLNADFTASADAFLSSDTFHNEYVALPNHETVAWWQGSGDEFDETRTINVKTSGNHTVNCTGVLGVMFDRDAIAICNEDRHTTSNYNARAEFWSSWEKVTVSAFNDLSMNGVVFIVA